MRVHVSSKPGAPSLRELGAPDYLPLPEAAGPVVPLNAGP